MFWADPSGLPASVAPHVGAWIETEIDEDGYEMEIVAPHVGAWIETSVP